MLIQPYVPNYDTMPECSVATWIDGSINTRNTVTTHPSVRDQVVGIQKKLREFKNEPDAFIQALVETLEADVRSEFQTRRRINDYKEGKYTETCT
jgi:hypothetical protein